MNKISLTKKVSLVLGISSLVFTLTACANQEEANTNNAKNTNNAVVEEQESNKIDVEKEKVEALVENENYFATLNEYGVELKDGKIYYNNKVIKNFVDIGSPELDYSDALYLLEGDSNKKDKVLLVKRDDSGKITGVEEYTREEFENM